MLFSVLLSWCFFITKPENSTPEEQKTKNLTYQLDSIKIGDSIWGLLLKEKEKTVNHVAFSLEGKTNLKWTIKVQKSMDESGMITFLPATTTATMTLPADNEWASYSINLFEWNIDIWSFDAQTKQALLSGAELQVKITISKFLHVGYFGSEYYSDITIEDYTILQSEILNQTKAEIEKHAQGILQALKNRDMLTLATYIDAEKGLRLTPYGNISDEDVILSKEELISETDEVRTRGTYVWSGEPIELTKKEYFDTFVYNADYLNAPEVIENKTIDRGSMIVNIEERYPNAEYREYFFPWFNPEYAGMDWEGLFLIFDHESSALLGLAHEEWTP